MSAALGTIQLFALAAALFLASGYPIAAGVERLARARIARLEPASRARVLGALAALPIVLVVTGLVACVLPSASAHLLGVHDHCDHHGGHAHLCPWHLMHDAGSPAGWALLAAIAVAVGLGLARGATSLASARALSSELDLSGGEGTHVIDARTPFSAAIGLLRPVVVVSRGLVEALSQSELEAAIAHEEAHAARRDALRLWLARLVWSLVPEAMSRSLLGELALACEEACDRAASERVADPLVVADAIVKASRAMAPLELGAAMGLGGTAVERRVRALLDPPTERANASAGVLAGLALAMLALAGPLHHATETVLGLLGH